MKYELYSASLREWGLTDHESLIRGIGTDQRAGARITAFLLVAQCIGLVASLLISVFFQYVVGYALSWPEEISLILFTWLVLLAGSLGVREQFHVRLTLFTDRLPGLFKDVPDRLIILAVGLFGGILIYSGCDLVERTAKHLTLTLRLPLDWLNYSAVVCGVLICLHSLTLLIKPKEQLPL